MKFRGLLAAAVVLAALAGVLYWSEHRKPSENAASSSAGPVIAQISPAAVTGITIKAKGAQPVVLAKSADKWQITAPTPAPADTDTISGMLAAVNPLTSERVIEEKPAGLAQFGLSDPAVEVDLTAGGKTTRLLFGDNTPIGDAVYAAAAGDPRVFTAPVSAKTGFEKSENDLRDKRLVPVEAASVSNIELTRNGQQIDFGRVQSGWQMQKPQPYRTDNYEVGNLLQQVTTVRWDPASPPQDAAAAWPKASPFASVKLIGKDGTDTLDIRKDHEDYYAKSSALPGVWKVDSALAPALTAALDRGVDGFRDKQLFAFGYADPNKVEYRSGATDLVLTRNGSDWFSDGKKMKADSAEAVVSALRDLAASKFVDSGFSKPTITLVVTSNNGRQVETLDVQPTSDGAIAKREDNPSLYFLDQATIDQLTSALAGVSAANARVPAT